MHQQWRLGTRLAVALVGIAKGDQCGHDRHGDVGLAQEPGLAAQHGIKEGFVKMLGGLGAWTTVIGAGFYFAYAFGRILGLFARTFREDIDFEL